MIVFEVEKSLGFLPSLKPVDLDCVVLPVFETEFKSESSITLQNLAAVFSQNDLHSFSVLSYFN